MNVDNREMGTQQLLDALTDHLALYHRKASRPPANDREFKGSLKEKAMLWFRSLSLERRCDALTIFDRSWIAVVLQMQRRLAKEGRGYFLVLPDVLEGEALPASGIKASCSSHASPSGKSERKSASEETRKLKKSLKPRKKPSTACSESAPAMALPSLCFRKARGLLARLDEEHAAGELLCENVEVFSSVNPNWLDVVCVREELLQDPDRFFAAMDSITDGGFLASIGASHGVSSWEELPWLTSMGYYTMPAFVANKLELAMQSTWLNDEGIHRPPKSLSKELRKTGWNVKVHPFNTSAMAAYKRYKAFKDWWKNLEQSVKLNVLRIAVAKVIKKEAMQAMDSVSKLGSKMDNRDVFGIAEFVDVDIYHRVPQVAGAKNILALYMAGLDMLQYLVSSSLGTAISPCSSACQAGDCMPSIWSSLNTAVTLPSNIMRQTCHLLNNVMVKFMELELLKSESGSLQVAQPKTKKKGRRKKTRSSEQKTRMFSTADEALGVLLHQEEMLSKVSSDAKKVDKEHKKTEKVRPEKSKGNKKKKQAVESHGEYSEVFCTPTSMQAGATSCSVYKEEMKSSQKPSSNAIETEVVTENSSDKFPAFHLLNNAVVTDLVENKSNNVPAFHLLEVDEHHSSNANSLPQAVNSNDSNAYNFSKSQPPNNQDSLDATGIAKKDLDTPKSSSSAPENDNDVVSVGNRLSMQAATGQVTEDRLSFQEDCSVELHARSNADRILLAASSGLENQSFNVEGNNTQSISPSQSSFYHLSGLSRSFLASHTPRERYWDTPRPHTMKSKSSALGFHAAHEWPGTFQVHFPRGRSQVISPATERLHLDVGRNWQQRLQASFVALRNPIMKVQSGTFPNHKWNSNMQNAAKTSDCAPLFSPGYAPNRSYPYGVREETSVLQSFPVTFATADISILAKNQNNVKHSDKTPDDTDYDESTYFLGDFDDHEGYIISEEESERYLLDMETHGEGDYNQYFGGGVMFWNTADYAGTGYSRPPSLSSEDSSWARHEADLSVVLDDIMGFPPITSSYNSIANPGMVSTSPPPTTYHSGFEHGVPVPGNEFGKFSPLPSAQPLNPEDDKPSNDCRKGGSVDGALDVAAIPILRPIVVVRDSSLESIRQHETRSPHVPQRRRESPWQKRPPSPVLRCVPPPPPPPPPSPVSEFGKWKGLTTARSGSSSPRRWGLLNAYHKEEQDVPFVLSEVLESAWGKRNLREKASIHPISGSLLRERLFTIPPLTVENDHPDIALPTQTTLLFKSDSSLQVAITKLHNLLHKEIEGFCKQVAAENMLRKTCISVAIGKVTHAMQVLWPRSRLKVFGSTATGLALPCSDVDIVVCLPPVRNLEPIREAGILEGRNGIKETCLQHAARYLADQDWVKSDTLKTIENTAIPIIMLVVHVSSHTSMAPGNGDCAHQNNADGGKEICEEENGPWGGSIDREFVRLDISFEAPSHTGLRTAELVRELTAQFPAITPLALVLKQFLIDRSLDQPYTGGLSSYCLVILLTRFLQHQHHLGCPFQQNLGSLLMDFLHFFGCVFDPRRMGICIRGGGTYVSRDRGHRIDPLYIEDPLYPTNNVGRNCFRILQCVKAFAEAYSSIEKALADFKDGNRRVESFNLLSTILPSAQRLKSSPV